MSRPLVATLDTSVWVPYLRARRYAATVDPLIATGRAWLHGVVLLELYAGAAEATDRRAVDAIRVAARQLARAYQPSEDDFVLAGQILSDYGRRRGRVRPRDHAHDLLVAIGAARTASLLLTENLGDMTRWADALRRRGLRVRVASPRA